MSDRLTLCPFRQEATHSNACSRRSHRVSILPSGAALNFGYASALSLQSAGDRLVSKPRWLCRRSFRLGDVPTAITSFLDFYENETRRGRILAKLQRRLASDIG